MFFLNSIYPYSVSSPLSTHTHTKSVKTAISTEIKMHLISMKTQDIRGIFISNYAGLVLTTIIVSMSHTHSLAHQGV